MKSFRDRSNKLKFATLICFEGPDSEHCAAAYADYVRLPGTDRINNPEDFAIDNGFKARLYCVDLHECQEHPLKG